MWHNSLLTSKEVSFKIPFYELYVNEQLLFPYGIDDAYKLKAKISSEQPYVLRKRKAINEKQKKIISETQDLKKSFSGFDERIRDAVIQTIKEEKKKDLTKTSHLTEK